LPTEPLVFSKFSSCVTGSGEIQIPSATKVGVVTKYMKFTSLKHNI